MYFCICGSITLGAPFQKLCGNIFFPFWRFGPFSGRELLIPFLPTFYLPPPYNSVSGTIIRLPAEQNHLRLDFHTRLLPKRPSITFWGDATIIHHPSMAGRLYRRI